MLNTATDRGPEGSGTSALQSELKSSWTDFKTQIRGSDTCDVIPFLWCLRVESAQ